jgi:hypothetical protein
VAYFLNAKHTHTQDKKGYIWILLVIDHFTKYIWGEAFKTKEAGPIAVWLWEIFSGNITMPERWHADNGGEFKNYHMDAVREKLGSRCDEKNMLLEYSHSMPRNPRCQGLVERANKTVKHGIHKQMVRDGYVDGEDETFEFRPYLKVFLFSMNRKVVSLYGFCPCVLMTGIPPEAPDHDHLSPAELRELHEKCAESQKNQAKNMTKKALVDTFKKGDVVYISKQGVKSHKDLKGKGGHAFTGRAVVCRPSRTTENQYKIRWLSLEGLVGTEKYGDISARLFGAWRMKIVQTDLKAEPTYETDIEIIREVMKEDEFPEVGAESEEEDGAADSLLPDHEQIRLRAERFTRVLNPCKNQQLVHLFCCKFNMSCHV